MLLLSGSPPSHCHRLLHNYYSLLRFSVSKPKILSTIHYFHCNYALFPIGIMYAFLSFSVKERLGVGGDKQVPDHHVRPLQMPNVRRYNMDFDLYVYEAVLFECFG